MPRQEFVVLALAVVGILLSGYSVQHHLLVKAQGFTDAACNINDSLSCDAAAKSKFSELFGFPLGVWGAGFFLAMIVLAFLSSRTDKMGEESRQGGAILALVGLLTSLVLAVISWTYLSSWCPVCLGVYAVTLALGGVSFWARSSLLKGRNLTTISSGLGNGAIAVAATLAIYNFAIKPAITPPPHSAKTESPNSDMSPVVKTIPFTTSPYGGLGEDYRKGSDTAKVVLQEFVDFECPACAGFYTTAKDLSKAMGDQLLVVFRNYPLDKSCNSEMKRELHKNACFIARMARCAGRYSKFWDYADIAFTRQKDASEERAKQWAAEVGLTQEQIDSCIQDNDILNKIKDDVAIGKELALQGTPAVFINGKEYHGQRDLDSLRSAVEKALNEAR